MGAPDYDTDPLFYQTSANCQTTGTEPRSTCFRPLRFSHGLSRPENAFGWHKKACCEVSIETSKVSRAKTLAAAQNR